MRRKDVTAFGQHSCAMRRTPCEDLSFDNITDTGCLDTAKPAASMVRDRPAD